MTVFAFALAIASSPALQAGTFTITGVDRKEVGGGRRGRLVNETLVVEGGGHSYRIAVRGAYHTVCVPPAKRFHVGEHVAFTIPVGARDREEISVARDDIRVVKG